MLRDKEKRAATMRWARARKAASRFVRHLAGTADSSSAMGPGTSARRPTTAPFRGLVRRLRGATQRRAARVSGSDARPCEAWPDSSRRQIVVPLEDAFHGATRAITRCTVQRWTPRGNVALHERTLRSPSRRAFAAASRSRLAGQGSPGLGNGQRGDLYLEIEFAPHPTWRVDGRDLYVTLRVAPWEAALGAAVNVTTPSGTGRNERACRLSDRPQVALARAWHPGSPPGDLT